MSLIAIGASYSPLAGTPKWFDKHLAQLTPRAMRYALALARSRARARIAAMNRRGTRPLLAGTQLDPRGVLEFHLPLTSSYIERHHCALQKTAALVKPP